MVTLDAKNSKKKGENKKRSCGSTILTLILVFMALCLVLSLLVYFVLPRFVDPRALQTSVVRSIKDLGLPTQALEALDFSKLGGSSVPAGSMSPRNQVTDQAGTWTAFFNPNGARDMVYIDGKLWSIPLHGQGLVAWDIKTGTYQHFTTFDGLAVNRVSRLGIDGEGRLIAMADNAGIIRLDAGYWQVIDLPELGQFLLTDQQGASWFATASGSLLYRLVEGLWETYDITRDPGINHVQQAMGCPDGRVYFQGTRLVRFQDDKFSLINLPENTKPGGLKLLSCTDQGNAYLVDDQNQFYLDGGEKLTPLTIEGEIKGRVDQSVAGNRGQVIFTSFEETADEIGHLYQLEDGNVTQLPYEGGRITALHSLPGRYIWASSGERIVQVKGRNVDRELGDLENHLPGLIYEMCPGSDGSMWFAGGAIYHFGDGQWEEVSRLDGVGQLDVRQCSNSGDETWFLHQSNLPMLISRVDDNWKAYSVDPAAGSKIFDLSVNDNKVALSTDLGIVTLDKKVMALDVLVNWQVAGLPVTVLLDKQGIIWAAIPGSGINGLTETRADMVLVNDSRFDAIDMVEGDGMVYLADQDGLSVFSESGMKRLSSLPLGITDLYYGHDLWASTSMTGAWQYAGGWVAQLTAQNSALPADQVNQVALDGQQALWMVVQGGLLRLEPAQGYREALTPDQLLLEEVDGGWQTYYLPLIFR